jgi:hypothetical protein
VAQPVLAAAISAKTNAQPVLPAAISAKTNAQPVLAAAISERWHERMFVRSRGGPIAEGQYVMRLMTS